MTEFRPGVVIKERQHNGYERTIVVAIEGAHVITERNGRLSMISWPNLRRYRIVRPAEQIKQRRAG